MIIIIMIVIVIVIIIFITVIIIIIIIIVIDIIASVIVFVAATTIAETRLYAHTSCYASQIFSQYDMTRCESLLNTICIVHSESKSIEEVPGIAIGFRQIWRQTCSKCCR